MIERQNTWANSWKLKPLWKNNSIIMVIRIEVISFSKSVSQKARKCSELSSNILGICSVKPSSKGHSRGWAQLDFFFRHQTEHIFYSWAVLLGFCNVSISCQLTVKACQISLDDWLFAWLNLKWCSFTTK